MTDSSNNLKHHPKISKKFPKKPTSRKNFISSGIYTHEEEKMEIVENQENIPLENNNKQSNRDQIIDSENENDENLELDIEAVKKTNANDKNFDRIAEISHYLILKNKINAKNAFEVPMLNVKEMSAFNQTEGDLVWKNLSSALEAGAKIYGFRVDSVHSETYKILGGLNRTELEENKKENGESSENNANNEFNFEDLMRRKAEISAESKTLERNLNNINTTKYDLEFDVDPLFSKTSAKFDETGSKGLLLNNINISCELQLLFDFDNQFISNKLMQQQKKHQNYSLNDFKIDKSKFKMMIESGVCPEILTFKEEIKKDKEIFNASKYFKEETMIATKDDMDQSMNMNFFMDSISFPEECILDTDLKEYNPEVEPIVDYENNNNIIINEESNFNQIHEDSNAVGNFSKENFFSQNNKFPGENTFSQFNLNSFQENVCSIGTGKSINFVDIATSKWMGPEQWEIKANFSKLKQSTKETGEPNRVKSKKTSQTIDFNMSIKENYNDLFNMSKRTPITNNANKNNDNQPIRHTYLLPIDHHVNLSRLGQIFLRDPTSSRFSYSQNPEENYNENNNYIQEIDDNLENEENIEEDHIIIENDTTMNDKKVHKGAIPIKELKEKIWNRMCLDKNFNKDENKIINENEENNNTMTFGSIFSQMPEIVGEANSKKVSVQTCFVTLLHLANEKILKFTPVNSNKDFLIGKS